MTTRKSYVFVNGALHEKTGDNTLVIDGKNWYNIGGTWTPADSPAARSFLVMPDIQPYKSTIDGSMITSRSQHRTHLRDNNCIEVGNERLPPPKREFTATRGLREELAARLFG
jgi:hypothetical protein